MVSFGWRRRGFSRPGSGRFGNGRGSTWVLSPASTHEWVGVTVREVAERAQIRSTARFATFRCGDGYTTSHPLNALYDSDVLLTYQWDGKPLPIEHGGPVRLLVPKRYAYKSAKWVRAVTFTDEEELGYWEVRGYSNTADPLTEDRYSF